MQGDLFYLKQPLYSELQVSPLISLGRVNHPLPPSLPSLPPFPPSLPPSFTPSLPSLPPLTPSLPPSPSFLPSLLPSLPSLPPSFPPSLPPSLPSLLLPSLHQVDEWPFYSEAERQLVRRYSVHGALGTLTNTPHYTSCLCQG